MTDDFLDVLDEGDPPSLEEFDDCYENLEPFPGVPMMYCDVCKMEHSAVPHRNLPGFLCVSPCCGSDYGILKGHVDNASCYTCLNEFDPRVVRA